MDSTKAETLVINELTKAEQKHQRWPIDILHGEMMERKIEVKVPNSVDPQSIACGINRQYGDHGVVARVVEPGSPTIPDSSKAVRTRYVGPSTIGYKCGEVYDEPTSKSYPDRWQAPELPVRVRIASVDVGLTDIGDYECNATEKDGKWHFEWWHQKHVADKSIVTVLGPASPKIAESGEKGVYGNLHPNINDQDSFTDRRAAEPKQKAPGENNLYVSPSEMHPMTDQEKQDYIDQFNKYVEPKQEPREEPTTIYATALNIDGLKVGGWKTHETRESAIDAFCLPGMKLYEIRRVGTFEKVTAESAWRKVRLDVLGENGRFPISERIAFAMFAAASGPAVQFVPKGDGRPVCYPSKVICKECLDQVGNTMKQMLGDLKIAALEQPAEREGER